MRGLPTVAGYQALSAGTVLIAAGGLALYQMTSLVLGPAQARELPVSLTIPTVDADRLPETVGPGASHILGMAVAPTPSATPSRQAQHRLAQPQAIATPNPAPIVATPTAHPVASEPPSKHKQRHPKPPKHHEND